MLRSFHETALSLPRMPEPERVRDGLLSVARFALLAGLAFALSRAALVDLAPACNLAPFAMALFAAGLMAGLNTTALIAGCMIGAIGQDIGHFNLSIPIGCAAILAGSLITSAAAPLAGRLRAALRRSPAIQARSPNDGELCMALAGIGILLPGLIYAGGMPWPSAQATAAALASLASAPFLREALLWVMDQRRRASQDARIGLYLMAMMVEAGVCAISLPAALALGTLTLSMLWPVGSLAGLGMGAAALLITGDGRFAAVLSLCGGAAQLCERSRDVPRAACVAAVGLVAGLFMGLPYVEIAGLCVGPVAAILLPRSVGAGILEWLPRPVECCDPDRLAMLLRSDTAERLKAMGAAFGDLAEGYLTPASMPDEQALMNDLRERLCEGCSGYGDCWAGETNGGARLLCELVAQAVEDEDAFLEEGAPVALARRCRRARAMPERVGALLRDFANARRDELKRGGENRLISAQFLQAQQLLSAMAAEQERPIRLRDRQARRAAAALKRADIDVADALLLTGRRSELVLTLREGRWTEAMAQRAAKCLRRSLGRVYRPNGAWGQTLRLTRAPRLAAEIGAGSASREPDAMSGDSHLTAMLDDERLLVLICDGMGSGEAAGRESAQAARLLGRFLAAGATWSLAVETVNAMLLNISSEDMFSTVDMLILNLSTGMAECVKLAACPTLIVRDGEIQRVEGGRLPLGILERVSPTAARTRLIPGDIVLMASDGVMDAADPAEVERLLLDPTDDMNALTEQLLARAQAAGGRPDDMTAICVRIKEDGI